MKRLGFLLAWICAYGSAHAEEIGLSPEEKHFFDEQSALQRDIQLMESKVKLLEQKVKYEDLKNKISEMAPSPLPMPPAPSVPPAPSPQPPSSNSAKGSNSFILEEAPEMKLVSVYGEGDALVGEVFYRGGRMTVRKGDVLPGDWRVTKIELTRMLLVKGKRHLEITIGSP